MLQITGKVINTFVKDGGDKYDDSNKVQLMGQQSLPNGEFKVELMDLTVKDSSAFEQFVKMTNKEVSIGVGAFSPNKGEIIYYVPSGAMPQPTLSQA